MSTWGLAYCRQRLIGRWLLITHHGPANDPSKFSIETFPQGRQGLAERRDEMIILLFLGWRRKGGPSAGRLLSGLFHKGDRVQSVGPLRDERVGIHVAILVDIAREIRDPCCPFVEQCFGKIEQLLYGALLGRYIWWDIAKEECNVDRNGMKELMSDMWVRGRFASRGGKEGYIGRCLLLSATACTSDRHQGCQLTMRTSSSTSGEARDHRRCESSSTLTATPSAFRHFDIARSSAARHSDKSGCGICERTVVSSTGFCCMR